MGRTPRTTAAIILGVIGGLFGFVAAISGFAITKLAELIPGLVPEELVAFVIPPHIAFPLVGTLFALLGIVAGAAAGSEPKRAGLLMIISAAGGIATTKVLYVPPALLLLAAAYFALTPKGRKKHLPI